jgi:hypothetical protein
MALSASSLAPLAAQMRIPASALFALPATVEGFARKAGMSADRMIHECLNNEALRDYLAEICNHAAQEVGA